MWWIVSIVTFVVLVPVAIVSTFFAIIMANGFMGNTDPMAISYLVCLGGGLLILSFGSGFAAKQITDRLGLPLWASGAAMVTLAVIGELVVSFIAFFIAVTFFAP